MLAIGVDQPTVANVGYRPICSPPRRVRLWVSGKSEWVETQELLEPEWQQTLMWKRHMKYGGLTLVITSPTTLYHLKLCTSQNVLA